MSGKCYPLQHKHIMFQTADVGRALISVDKLNEAGCDVILQKRRPRIVTSRGEVVKLRKKGDVLVLNMWVKIPGRKDDRKKHNGTRVM